MQRITITIDDDLLNTIDDLMQRKGYTSRSEVMRDLLREAASRDLTLAGQTPCVAVLSYVYDHQTRALARQLTRTYHDNHDLSVAAMHVHLDHTSCLEVAVLRGTVSSVRNLSDEVTAQRGVRHAKLHAMPAETIHAKHRHGERIASHPHLHA